jgi:hypothetical protein
VKGYEDGVFITDSSYYLPLLDADSNIHVVCAHRVDEITTVTRTRLPPIAREIFPVIRAFMPWMETGAGPVELLMGLDNPQWLPIHMEDSWNPDDDMRLMKSAFEHRFIITDGWGRNLLPPEAPAGDQEGAAEGQDGGPGEAQEIQLQEYQGWNQSTWSRGGGGAWGTQECPGSRGRSAGGRGRAAIRRPSPLRERTISARGQRGARGHPQGQGGHPVQSGPPHDPPNGQSRLTRSSQWPVLLLLPGLSNCEGSHIPTPEECLAYSNRQGQQTPCSDWPS